MRSTAPSPLHEDSVGLLTRGYRLGEHLWRRTRPDARAVGMRLLARDALFVRGAEGVALFYDGERTARHGAMPALVQETLFGHGSVHSLDGSAHRHRKATFIDVAYEDEQVARLTPHLEREWRAEVDAWTSGISTRTAYDAAVVAFGRAVMRWAGLPGTAKAKNRWSRRLAQIVDGFGAPYSPSFVSAILNRRWSDGHAENLIAAVRLGELQPAEGTALFEWAWHRDEAGVLLAPRTAGIELQNVIRPMIAVARFVAYAAKQLHEHPEWRARIATEADQRGSLTGGPLATAFAQEIRRTSPFVPMLPAWATQDVELDGERVPAGSRVVLDILGTNTDAASWERPGDFVPDRFVGVDDYEAIAAFVPHGGADPRTGHRCPGEKLAIAGLAAAVSALSDRRLEVLDEGLDVNLRRLPTMPASGGKVRSCPFHRKP